MFNPFKKKSKRIGTASVQVTPIKEVVESNPSPEVKPATPFYDESGNIHTSKGVYDYEGNKIAFYTHPEYYGYEFVGNFYIRPSLDVFDDYDFYYHAEENKVYYNLNSVKLETLTLLDEDEFSSVREFYNYLIWKCDKYNEASKIDEKIIDLFVAEKERYEE